MKSPLIQEPQTQKLSLSSSIKNKPFSSSRSNLSGLSKDISGNKDFSFNLNFQKVKNPVREIKNPVQEPYKKSSMVLETLGYPKNQMNIYNCYNLDTNQPYNYMLVNVNHWYLDEFMKPKTVEKGFQLVKFRENNYYEQDLLKENYHCNMSPNTALTNVVSVDEKGMSTNRSKIPYHIDSIPKPQVEYNIKVNNANQAFEHVLLQKTADGSKYIHPLEKFKFNDFVEKNVCKFEPIVPPPVNDTPLKFVQEEQELKELVHKLCNVNEFAVDLEHNQYRSFQGLTCLMQISTRTEDFVIDTLKLHDHIGPYMRDVFSDPTKKKVMHGADKDIMWLQRDFGIYVCNMFDTGQASRVLNMEKNSLEHLLMYFCGVPLNKEYQTADWRLRPLTNDMLKYAREDTHYLLFVHDLMIKRLLSSSPDPKFPELLVMEVYRRSYDVCLKLYEKEPFNNKSYLNVYGLHEADLNGQQLSIVEALCSWRDIVARSADESTGYILSNKNVIEIAKQMPTTTVDLFRVLIFPNIHVQQNLCSILSMIQNSRKNASAYDEIAKKLKQERLENANLRTGKKRSEEASYTISGNSNVVVANQFGNATDKKRLDHDNTAKALLNISFGSYKKKPESVGPTMEVRETVKRNEPVGARATNEVEKNVVSVHSSRFQKCLQTTNEPKMSQAGFKRGGS